MGQALSPLLVDLVRACAVPDVVFNKRVNWEQVVSSAIGYDPPGNPITIVLDKYAGNTAHAVTHHGAHDPLYETCGWLFKDSSKRPSVSPRFANRNNFVEFKIRHDMSGPWAGLPLMTCTYHVRAGTNVLEEGAEPDTVPRTITLPPLLPKGKEALAAAIHEEFIADLLPPKAGVFKKYCCFCC
jgi:hypothetical protein